MELQFKNVTKDYGNVHAVEHVTHSMGKGVYGLLGVNGAGKTTLMRMICTAITPTSGEILWKTVEKMFADQAWCAEAPTEISRIGTQ